MAVFLVPVEEGRPIVLDKAIVLIGRQADCDVVLSQSRRVSRRHCCVAQVNNRFIVRDLGSMNGVRINGKRIDQEAEVRLGDVISIGDLGYVLQSKEVARSRHEKQLADRARKPSAKADQQNPHPPVELSQDFPVPIPDVEPVPGENGDNPFGVAHRAGDSFSDPRRESSYGRESDGPRGEGEPRDSQEYHGTSSHVELLPD